MEAFNSINELETTKFYPLNKNLKKIIFDFLKSIDQRKIYWSSKKLRKLLPASSFSINISRFKKHYLYKLPETKFRNNFFMFELYNGNIALFSNEKFYLFKFYNASNLELIRTSLSEWYDNWIKIIQLKNDDIISTDTYFRINVYDICLNLSQRMNLSYNVTSLCEIN